MYSDFLKKKLLSLLASNNAFESLGLTSKGLAALSGGSIVYRSSLTPLVPSFLL